ncbi:MAG TPA: DUF4202 domain-containing protein [bacterium]|nr:DUF4202 domain-containing protein [bacterium]
MSFEKAVEAIRKGLGEDPRIERVGGKDGPRDLLFTERVVEWVGRLSPRPSQALLLATWGHVLYRWRLPRESEPKTTAGYHKWRRAQSKLSADEVDGIVTSEGVEAETASAVRALILKTNFPADPDARVLEDADCLAFLELKLEDYVSEWDEPKLLRILKGTWEKMSPEARTIAAGLLGQKSLLNSEILDKMLSNIP